MPRIQQPRPSGSTLLDIPWKLIRPMPGQPREYFDPAKLDQLARSIKRVGQRTPVQVVPLANDRRHQYELIDGQRRWHAVQLAGLDDLRCEVFDVQCAETRYVMSVVANLCRAGHEPLEIARACKRMQATMTLEEIADALGMSVAWVSQHLSLLKLAPEVHKAMDPALGKKRLPYSAALLLAPLPHEEQVKALERIGEVKASPLRAVKAVVGTVTARIRPNARNTRPSDLFVLAKRRFERVRTDLATIASDAFTDVLKTRQPEEVRATRAALEEIAREVERLLAAPAV